jgi:PAS domain S-box-containing protein
MEAEKPAEISDQALLFYQSFSHSNDAIMICDTEGKVLYSNAAFTKLYGFAAEEVLGQPISIVRHPETPAEVFSEMWQDILHPETGFWKGEIRNKRKDGTPVDVLLTITTVKDRQGDTTAYMSIALDITQKKQLEKTMMEQEKLSSIGLLASGIAHEIGSPLNVISGRAEMVRSQLRDQFPQAIKSLEIIVQQTDRISDLVKGLLNFSRPTGQRSPERFVEIELSNVLEESGKLLHKALEERGVRFAVQNHTASCVTWDFNKSEQVFINLLQNAMHAVEGVENPTIEVHFRPLKPGEKEESELQEKTLAVEVRDNGTGIPKADLNRIFDPFFTTKAAGMGTGLGLSVVYGLVKEVEGTIRVESKAGEGTVFTLYFPVENRSS